MSCISSNFSSFFLDSLNDPSEFAKYLSNGENKVQSLDDFQVFGGSGSSNGSYSNSSEINGGVSVNSDSPLCVNGDNNHHPHPVHHQQQPQQQQQQQQLHQQPQPQQHAQQPQQQQQQQQQSLQQHPTNQQLYVGPNHQHQVNYHPIQHHPVQTQHTISSNPQTYNHQQPVGATRWSNAHSTTPSVPGGPDHSHSHHHLHQQSPHPSQQSQQQPQPQQQQPQQQQQQQQSQQATQHQTPTNSNQHHHQHHPPHHHQHQQHHSNPNQHHQFDGSFEFLKYLRHTGDYGEETPSSATPAPATPCSNSNLIDLDSSTTMTSHSHRTGTPLTAAVAVPAATPLNRSSLDIDTFDHDSKHNLFDLQHQTSNNSNESSCDPMGTFSGAHLNASNSNISSESAGSDNSNNNNNINNNNNQSNASKPLVNFSIKDNFEVHPAHKVEEGIFQHMNKLPVKKKDTLKQLGVRFTGQMTLADKSIVVENFIKFCQEYDVTDHRPFLALNQSGMNKPEQIKFARYLGQGLPSFTLFCIYSNFKNLFCTKRTETYGKDGYNLQYILDKTKRFLSKATADLKSLTTQSQSNDGVEFPNNNNGAVAKSEMPKILERFVIYENFDVHETHRIEDGICTHLTRLPPKKQELLKQFGIQSNQTVTYYEKYIIIENFIKFCNEYKVTDHRAFLDFHESGLPKSEQLKFVRYLGQGLPNLTLNKIYLSFKDVLGLNRIEKITADGYNLDIILKKKKKNLYNRMHAAGKPLKTPPLSNLLAVNKSENMNSIFTVHRESTEAAKQAHRESLAS